MKKILCLIASVTLTFQIISCSEKTPKEPIDLRISTMDAEELREMANKAEASINPILSDGLSMKIWAVDSMVVDPISIQVTDDGTLYYSSSGRKNYVEFDIRGHQKWEIPSIKLQSVEDKRKFLREELAPERSDENQWLKDLNEDGSHDWLDMLVPKEKIFTLKDTDGDGLADWTQLVVEDFNEEVTDVAGAVLMHEGDLFVGVGPDMWRLKDKNGDGIMDEKESISHGYAIHIGFGAHGMSGAKVGPDGRIYWGIGDIGFNGVDKEGNHWKYPNRGVVVRSNPDGTDFEVYAMGVRNTHEFTWDEYNNLISVDNDGDHRGESERLVYLVNGSDTGWRINWQFGKYLDPDNNTYKVWMDEKLYLPRHEGQAAYITPCIINYVNGPTGMVYNPGTALGPKWKNHFFVAEFVGNPGGSGIHAFQLQQKGASFELSKTEMIMRGMLATGLDFGPDGALYAADWIIGWNNKSYGRIWKLDDEEGKDWELRNQTAELLKKDFAAMSIEELDGHLYHPDMRIRRKAQFELAKKGKKGAEIFEKAINQRTHQLARIHGIVGLSQMARLESMDFAEPLIPLLKDSDPEIRAQAAKWLGDIRFEKAGPYLLSLLVDEYPRAIFFAAEAIGRVGYEPGFPSLVNLLDRNNDEDAYIRHAVTLALARLNQPEESAKLAYHPSNAVRLGGVLVMRRLEDPNIRLFLNDPVEYIVTEAARAINDDFSIEEALPDLGNLLVKTSFSNEPLLRRAINANLRVGTEKAMDNLLTFITDASRPIEMRKEAIAALGTWTKPSVLDRVDGRYRGEIERDGTLIREKSAALLTKMISAQEESIKLATITAIGKLGITEANESLFALMRQSPSVPIRIEALKTLALLQATQTEQAVSLAIKDNNKSIRVEGLRLIDQLDLDKSLKVNLLADIIETKTIEEKQAAIVALTKVPAEFSGELVVKLLDKMGKGQLPNEILLELSELVENSNQSEWINAYQEASNSLWKGDAVASYQSSLYGGDVIKGRTIFFESQTGQCMRCHAYDDMGGNVGPSMNGIGKLLNRQELLEALVDPSKRIAPGYGMTSLELATGKKIGGILDKEDKNSITLKSGFQPDTLILKKDIVERNDAPSSMPAMQHLLSRREIRDLVSYLATLKD